MLVSIDVPSNTRILTAVISVEENDNSLTVTSHTFAVSEGVLRDELGVNVIPYTKKEDR